ncbi:methyltransferase domain-containing protein [Methanomicrobium sp. W14]
MLDVACGNENFSLCLAKKGAEIVAFDYSDKIFPNAKKRRMKHSENIL